MKIPIEIGALSPSLDQQLSGVKIAPEDLAALQRDMDAINRCYVRGYIGAQNFDAAGRALIKKIQLAISKQKARA